MNGPMRNRGTNDDATREVTPTHVFRSVRSESRGQTRLGSHGRSTAKRLHLVAATRSASGAVASTRGQGGYPGSAPFGPRRSHAGRMRDAAFALGPALLLLLLYAIHGPHVHENSQRYAVVTERVRASELRVVDGDTIVWQGTTYDLAGFDAPETLKAECEAERARGEAAASVLRSVILGAHQVELGVHFGIGDPGHRIAYLRVSGEDVGARLIAQGLARKLDDGASYPWCGSA